MVGPIDNLVCPQCGVAGPVRLQLGQVCAACEAQNVWTRADGARLVIDRGDIDAALARRAGEVARESAWARFAPWLLPGISLTLGVIATAGAWIVAQPSPIGPLPPLLASMKTWGAVALVLGFHGFAFALIALARSRKTRHFRRLSVLAPTLIGACLGLVTAGFGGYGVLASQGFPLRYATMPVNEAIGEASPIVERIMRATAVVVAPMERDGDGKTPALGSAAVIATDGNRAWLLTNSHVAMPYAAVASWRHASGAQPVWVQFSDGRSALARVAWTARPPLDVAVLEVEVVDPPAPVQVAPDSIALEEGASVTFVPLPYRDGWMVHHGLVLKREEHLTPAGPYSLLFTSLPVQPGDSGSGLFDDDGRLVGINTWTRMAEGRPPQGISLPSETMRTIVRAIEDGAMAHLDELLEAPGAR